MQRWWWVLGILGCSGAPSTDERPTTDPGVTTGTDTGATGSDTGSKTAAADPRLRALHVGALLPGQDMLGNGNPGQPPLVDLAFGEAWPSGQPWATRPANTYTFSFTDDGAAAPWTEFDYELEGNGWYSLVVMGTPDNRQVLATADAVTDVAGDRVRMRWTHAAPSLGTAVMLQDATVTVTYGNGAALAYGDTVESDETVGEVHLWLDLDGNKACDVGEVFAPFERAPGDYFHVLIVEDAEGELFLQGHTLSGQAPMRPLAKACP